MKKADTAKGVLLLLGIGLVAAGGQLFMTEGFRHISVTTGSILGMLVPVLNCFVGVCLFNEETSPGSMAGAAIVIASCVVVTVDWQKGGRRA